MATYSEQLIRDIENNTLQYEELDLSDQPLSVGDVRALARALKNNTHIKKLFVENCGITGEGAEALADTALTVLRIDHNEISDRGARALARNPTLTYLSADQNKIGDRGAIALAANPRITCLHLTLNHIGNEGAEELAKNQIIKELWIDNNYVGLTGVKALLSSRIVKLEIASNHNNEDPVPDKVVLSRDLSMSEDPILEEKEEKKIPALPISNVLESQLSQLLEEQDDILSDLQEMARHTGSSDSDFNALAEKLTALNEKIAKLQQEIERKQPAGTAGLIGCLGGNPAIHSPKRPLSPPHELLKPSDELPAPPVPGLPQ